MRGRRTDRRHGSDERRRTDDVVEDVQELVASHEQVAKEPGRSDRGTGLVLGAGALAACGLLALVGPAPTATQTGLVAFMVLLYAAGCRVEIVLPGGAAVPTQAVLVGLLLATPPTLAPLAVLLGLHLGDTDPLLRSVDRWQARWRALIVRSLNAWSSVAPAVLLWLTGPSAPTTERAGLYLLCLLAQVTVDVTVTLIRATALGLRRRPVLGSLAWTVGIDVALAPVGLCVVLAAHAEDSTGVLTVLAAPTVLVWLMAQDRARHLGMAVTMGQAFDTVREQALVDSLTGLGNRRAWDEAVTSRMNSAESLVVVMGDVDGLKRVNDHIGHDAGDQLLREVALVLAASAPPGALVARLGGDEFGVLASVGADQRLDPRALVDHMRHALAAAPSVHGAPLSCSLGWAECPPGSDLAQAVLDADRRAGEDKSRRRAGRDTTAVTEIRAT